MPREVFGSEDALMEKRIEKEFQLRILSSQFGIRNPSKTNIDPHAASRGTMISVEKNLRKNASIDDATRDAFQSGSSVTCLAITWVALSLSTSCYLLLFQKQRKIDNPKTISLLHKSGDLASPTFPVKTCTYTLSRRYLPV